ncbi:hypothetical protein LG322_02470 [Microbacterium aerolatum]
MELLLKSIDDPAGAYERRVRFRPEPVVRESTVGFGDSFAGGASSYDG